LREIFVLEQVARKCLGRYILRRDMS
jgi:hypothetical protein